MPVTERIALLDASLELTCHLDDEERAGLGQASLPVITVEPGELDLPTILGDHAAFGATVLDGIVMTSLRIREQTGIGLLGPGDLLVQSTELLPDWLIEPQLRTTAPARLALLGRDLLAAIYRWPRVVQGIYACLGDQLARLRAQLVICQLPRVHERVLAMLWLLAESWGQVTPSGIRLPLTLTHETLGSLIGARRPTVTLALRKLTEDGALVHQDSGWLLLERPRQPTDAVARILPPEIARSPLSRWAWATPEPIPIPVPVPAAGVSHQELLQAVRALRAQHEVDREASYAQLERVRNTRARVTAMRKRIADDALRRRRQPPSS